MQKGIIRLETKPSILSAGTVVGKTEHEGAIGRCFDLFDDTDSFGKKTWEQSEGEMCRLALNVALEKAGLKPNDVDALFAGDLLNQCASSGYGLEHFDIPFFGIFGACSTAVEGLILASLLVDSGKIDRAAVVTSSHNCSAERQFRFPLEYGGQRTPTSQWTVTGAAAFLIGRHDKPPYLTEVLPGRVRDKGIRDANNMGAAMAPAAVDTFLRYFRESGRKPEEFAAVVTGDLGFEGSGILNDFLSAEGIPLNGRHIDCGLTIYDRIAQDVHAGGSGCGCCASVLGGYLLPRVASGEWKDILVTATGAMMNPTAIQQGLSIPGIAHLIHITAVDTDIAVDTNTEGREES